METPSEQPDPDQGEIVSPQLVHETAESKPPRARRSGLRLLVFFLLLLGLPILIVVGLGVGVASTLSISSSSLTEQNYLSRRWKGDKKIAIVRVEGTIISGTGFVKQQIEKVIKDEDVVAVVLRVNSPGGTITGSDYILHHLQEMRKERASDGDDLPMVVSMGSLAASGGYYVSMAIGDTPDSIFAEPTTWTGSIGVIIPHYNMQGLLEDWKIEEDSIASHRLKGMGGIARQMTEEETAIFQQLVDESFDRFKSIILKGRPNLTEEKLNELATGQVYTTKQALANGLVDKEGFLEDAIVRAIQLAGLTDEDVRVVEYKTQPTLLEVMLARAQQPSSELQLLLDLTTPRAYYLCTWLPGATSRQWREAR